MTGSMLTKLARRLPPVNRLYEAVTHLNILTATLFSEQAQQHEAIRLLLAKQDGLSEAPAQLNDRIVTSQLPPNAPNDVASLDQMTSYLLQSAALRHLPFLPGKIEVTDRCIMMSGYAGAPEGLTANMAFFINGRRMDKVEYPVIDKQLLARFDEVQGMGLLVHATMTEHLAELRAARFWRFDASPTGQYIPSNWRQAVHFMNPAFERFSLPPALNITRVIGDDDPTRFAMGGAMVFKNLQGLLSELGFGWGDYPNILDWGCGAGRVTRYLLSETVCTVTGADIDADNIAWCENAYPSGHFVTVPLRPPTRFVDGNFDLVIGISVMTHLQEADQWLWLVELQRITRPGALIFLSVSGPTQFAYNGFPPQLFRQIQSEGFLDMSRDPALDSVIQDTEYYRAAFHSRLYITEAWGRYFEVLAITDALAALQDFVVMRRR